MAAVLACVCLGLQSKGTGNPSITAALKTVPLATYNETLDVYIYIIYTFLAGKSWFAKSLL